MGIDDQRRKLGDYAQALSSEIARRQAIYNEVAAAVEDGIRQSVASSSASGRYWIDHPAHDQSSNEAQAGFVLRKRGEDKYRPFWPFWITSDGGAYAKVKRGPYDIQQVDALFRHNRQAFISLAIEDAETAVARDMGPSGAGASGCMVVLPLAAVGAGVLIHFI
jgi:hypothetical protein